MDCIHHPWHCRDDHHLPIRETPESSNTIQKPTRMRYPQSRFAAINAFAIDVSTTGAAGGGGGIEC